MERARRKKGDALTLIEEPQGERKTLNPRIEQEKRNRNPSDRSPASGRDEMEAELTLARKMIGSWETP